MSKDGITIGGRGVGPGEACYIIAEIGINHNGDLDIAKQLIAQTKDAGFDAVKFQKRTPDVCVPQDQRDVERDTPWGRMTYMEYRYRVEFGRPEFEEIDRYCRELDIHWFCSAWDAESVDFLEPFEPVCYKVASACLTDDGLLERMKETGRPIILSTGMSNLDEIDHAVEILSGADLLIMQTTSTYPSKDSEINLSAIDTLRERYKRPVGYSGHETGVVPSVMAVVGFDACAVERHVTLDRTMWGSDQAASLEQRGMELLIRDIRIWPVVRGDGNKRLLDSEVPIKQKLRRIG
jgi:N-acetylneuraminate synthase